MLYSFINLYWSTFETTGNLYRSYYLKKKSQQANDIYSLVVCVTLHYLYVDLIVGGSMYWTIQAKTHNGYPSVYIKSSEGGKTE